MTDTNKFIHRILGCLPLLSFPFFCGSCDDADIDNYTFATVDWISDSDTLVNASSHEYIVEFDKNKCPANMNDWYFSLISMYDYEYGDNGSDNWYLMSEGQSYEGVTCEKLSDNCASLGWIVAEKIEDNKNHRFKITIKENTSGKKRAARIAIKLRVGKNSDVGSEYFVYQDGQSSNEPYEVKIRYKSRVYFSMAHIDEDGNAVYEDSLFLEKLREIGSRDDVEAFVMGDDGIVDYFDSDDFASQPALKRMMQPIPDSEIVNVYPVGTTRGYSSMFAHCDDTALGFVEMFDDNNFKDTSIHQNLYEPFRCFDVVDMKDRGLNDKISSLVLTYQGDDPDICAVLTVWEDAFFNNGDNDRTKHKINFVASYKDRMAFSVNLKSVPCLNSSNTWNDRISSCSFHFGYYGLYPKEY